LTIKLVSCVKLWKEQIKRATATFYIKPDKASSSHIHYLSKSNRYYSCERDSSEETANQCVLCFVKNDKYLQQSAGLMLKKLKFFVNDFVVFMPRTPMQAEQDIASGNYSRDKNVSTFS